MYKEDLALNNLQWLRRHKSNQIKSNIFHMYKDDLVLNNLQWLMCPKTQPKQILYI